MYTLNHIYKWHVDVQFLITYQFKIFSLALIVKSFILPYRQINRHSIWKSLSFYLKEPK